MQITLTEDMKELIDEIRKIAPGVYSTTEEIVLDGLFVLKKHQQKKLDELRKEIQIGTDQIARGEYYTEEEFEERWKKRLSKDQ